MNTGRLGQRGVPPHHNGSWPTNADSFWPHIGPHCQAPVLAPGGDARGHEYPG